MTIYVVDTTEDVVNANDDVMSLREAAALANADPSDDQIVFNLGGFENTITLTDVVQFSDAVQIIGPGNLTIVAADGERIFEFTSGEDFEISGVAFQGGTAVAPGGGAIRAVGDVRLEDVSFTGATTTGGSADGGAVSVEGELLIIDSTFTGNTTQGDLARGGAVYSTGNMRILGSTFTGNSTEGSSATGGAVATQGTLLIRASTFDGNSTSGTAASGGAVFARQALTVDMNNELEGALFTNNSASGDDAKGGAIFAESTFTLDGASFTGNSTGASTDNSATEGGAGGALFATGTGDVSDTVFTSNMTIGSISEGGALASAATIVINGSTFSLNQTMGDNSPGGAVSAGAVDIAASTFDQNETMGEDSGGGAIAAEGETDVANSVVTDNATRGNESPGGAISGGLVIIANIPADTPISGNLTEGTDSPGGAIAASVNVDISNSEIDGNMTMATNGAGGGVYSEGRADVSTSVISGNSTAGAAATGGGLSAVGEVTITDSTIRGNSTANDGARGGGIYSDDKVTLLNANIQDNSTTGTASEGGGIAALMDVLATSSTITGNSTATENAFGGGLYAAQAATLLAVTVSGNATTGEGASGGGVYVGGPAVLTNTTFAANSTAGDNAEGGGLYAGGDLTLYHSTVTGNRTDGSNAPGGGIFFEGAGLIAGTILIGNAATAGGEDELGQGSTATLATRGVNVLDDSTVSPEELFELTDVLEGTTISAGRLGDNGGLVATVKLLELSSNPAIDVADTALLSESAQGVDFNGDGDKIDLVQFDARGDGFDRTIDIPNLGNDGISADYADLGAYEATQANRVPVTPIITQTMSEDDDPLVVNVISGTTDPDGDGFVLTGLGPNPDLLGVASTDSLTGTVTYDPGEALQFLADGEARIEEIEYLVTDDRGGVGSGILTVTVSGANDAPVAEDDARTVSESAGQTSFDVVAESVTDPDTDDTPTITSLGALSLVEADRSDFGSIAISSDGQSIVYDTGGDFTDLDAGDSRTLTADYTVSDGNGGTDTATLTITVEGVTGANIPPDAADDAATVAASAEQTSIDVLGNDTDADGDPISISGIGDVTIVEGDRSDFGSIAIAGGLDAILFDPEDAFDDLDNGETRTLLVDYSVSDGNGGTDTAELTITVSGSPPNMGPDAQDDIGSTETGASFLIDVLANDSDDDGDPLEVAIADAPPVAEGRVVVTEISDGAGGMMDALIFRSAPGFVGTTSFSYEVSDGQNGGISTAALDTADVTIVVAEPVVSPGSVALGDAQRIAYLYEAGLDREGNIDTPGLNFWIGALADGFSEREIAQAFLESDEFTASFGDIDTLTDLEFIDLMFLNVLGREADAFGSGFWLGRLVSPEFERADMLVEFSVSPENIAASPVVATLEETTPGEFDFA